MLPMTTAVQKPQETYEEFFERVKNAESISVEDAEKVLEYCRDTQKYWSFVAYNMVTRAIAIKLSRI